MKTAAIAASSNGDNVIVAAVAGSKVRVLAFHLSYSGTVNSKWRDGTTDLTGLTFGVANSGIMASLAPPRGPRLKPEPYFETSAGNALQLNLSVGSVPVGGFVCYDLEPV